MTTPGKYGELAAVQAEKESFFIELKKHIEDLDAEGAAATVKKLQARGYTLPEVEYSSIGAGEEGLFYRLVRAASKAHDYALLEGPAGSPAVENAIRNLLREKRTHMASGLFRSTAAALYDGGLRPDVRSMGLLAALGTGEIPKNALWADKNSPYGRSAGQFEGTFNINGGWQEDRYAINFVQMDPSIFLSSKDAAVYPFYMPYMGYTLKQRIMFDELVWFASFVNSRRRPPEAEEGRYNEANFAETAASYRTYEIAKKAEDGYAAIPDDPHTLAAAQLDQMNILLEHRFDYLWKCWAIKQNKSRRDIINEYIEKNKKAVYKFKTRIVDEYKHKPIPEDYRDVSNGVYKGLGRGPDAYNYMEYVMRTPGEQEEWSRMVRSYFYAPELLRPYFKMLKGGDFETLMRLGFALTHPATLARYDALKFKDEPGKEAENEALRLELEYFTGLYMEYKKLFFAPGPVLKSDEEIKKLPPPVWAKLIEDVDLVRFSLLLKECDYLDNLDADSDPDWKIPQPPDAEGPAEPRSESRKIMRTVLPDSVYNYTAGGYTFKSYKPAESQDYTLEDYRRDNCAGNTKKIRRDLMYSGVWQIPEAETNYMYFDKFPVGFAWAAMFCPSEFGPATGFLRAYPSYYGELKDFSEEAARRVQARAAEPRGPEKPEFEPYVL